VRGEEVIADGAAHGLFVLQLLAVFEAARVEAGRADALLLMLALLQGVSVARALEVARDAIDQALPIEVVVVFHRAHILVSSCSKLRLLVSYRVV